jgi:hypothetical protein
MIRVATLWLQSWNPKDVASSMTLRRSRRCTFADAVYLISHIFMRCIRLFWLHAISFFYSSLVILCAAHRSFGHPGTFILFLSLAYKFSCHHASSFSSATTMCTLGTVVKTCLCPCVR